MAQSIVAYVDETLDNARLGPVHKRVLAIICAGLFFDVIDFIILGSLVPNMLRTHFATAAGVGTVGTATLLGLFLGALGQGRIYRSLWPQGGIPVRRRLLQPSHNRGGTGTYCRIIGYWTLSRRDRVGGCGTAVLFLCRRVFAKAHPRPDYRVYAICRRRLRMAAWDVIGSSPARHGRLARGMDHHRLGRSCSVRGKLSLTGIAALAGHPRSRQRSTRST